MATSEEPSRYQRTDVRLIRLTQDYLEERLRGVAPDSLLVHAWEDFYDLYNELIRRFARSYSIPEADLDDCVQDAWSAVIADLPNLQYDPNRGRFRSWLYALMRNKATDRIRRLARRPASSLQTGAASDPSDHRTGANPADAYEAQWDRQLFEAVLAKLRQSVSPTSYRVFEMRVLKMRSAAEVAEATGLTAEQVRARQHRVKCKLGAMLALYSGRDFGGES